MTTQPKPISDEDLERAKAKLDRHEQLQAPNHVAQMLIARIEAQQASLASKDAEIERLRDAEALTEGILDGSIKIVQSPPEPPLNKR